MEPVIDGADSLVEETAPTLAEHRAEFPTPTGRRPPPVDPALPVEAAPDAPVEPKPPKTRHRAASQQMRAEDVPRLKEADRKRKEAEDRAATLEAELKTLRASPAPVVDPPPQRRADPAVPPVAAASPSEPDPNDLAKYPYGSADPQFIRDTARWTFEAQTTERETKQQQAREAADLEASQKKGREDFSKRWAAEKAADPTFEEIAKRPTLWPVGQGHPIDLWIWTRQAGLKVLRFLNDPANVAETQRIMALPTPDDQVVALALLEQRFHTPPLDEAITGAPAAAKLQPSPRPPTPVRTGPMRPSDTPPPEGSSLREHQRYYPQSRRR